MSTDTITLPARALESETLRDELVTALGEELAGAPAAEVPPDFADGLETLCHQAAALSAGRMTGPGQIRLHFADGQALMVSVEDSDRHVSAQNFDPTSRDAWLKEREAKAKAGAKKIVVEPAKAKPPAAAPATSASGIVRGGTRSRFLPPQGPPPAAAARGATATVAPTVPLPAAAVSRLAESTAEPPAGKKSKAKDDDK